MTLDEKIYEYIQKLPRSFQEELLDYVEYLVMKAEQQEKQAGLRYHYRRPCATWKMR